MTRAVDDDFLALPRNRLAYRRRAVGGDAAGASYADLRVHAITTEAIKMRDGELETAVVNREIGLAVRVIVDGTWGFASHAGAYPGYRRRVGAPRRRRGRDAVGAQRRAHRAGRGADPPQCHLGVFRTTASTRSPSRRLRRWPCSRSTPGGSTAADGVDHVSALVNTVKEQTFYADTFGSPRSGSGSACRRWRRSPSTPPPALAESMRTLAPPTGPGRTANGQLAGTGLRTGRDSVLLAEKTKAPGVVAGPTDLVIDPTNLWLTIHESIGHATEYDPGDRLRGRLCRHLLRHPGQTRHRARYGSPI